jgi:hypothetical protein
MNLWPQRKKEKFNLPHSISNFLNSSTHSESFNQPRILIHIPKGLTIYHFPN